MTGSMPINWSSIFSYLAFHASLLRRLLDILGKMLDFSFRSLPSLPAVCCQAKMKGFPLRKLPHMLLESCKIFSRELENKGFGFHDEYTLSMKQNASHSYLLIISLWFMRDTFTSVPS